MEGAPREVGRRSDAIFLGLGDVLAAHFLEPARRLGGPLEIEAAGIEDLCQRHIAHAHGQDLGIGVQTAQDRHELLALGAGDQINFADEDDVSELHLLDQQLSDGALIVLAQCFAPACQAFGFVEVAQEVDPVDYRDHGV